MRFESIRIENAIMHILDTAAPMPVLSDIELEAIGDVGDFIDGHIERLLQSDDSKPCLFRSEDSLFLNEVRALTNENFIDTTRLMALRLFELMQKHVDIPPADVLFARATADGMTFFLMLKLNYRSSYVHHVLQEDAGVLNRIIPMRTTLPGGSAKADEAVIVNLANHGVSVVEKKVILNGEKGFYLTDLFMDCDYEHAPSKKLEIIAKTAEKINKQYYDNSIEKKVAFNEALHDTYGESGEVDVMKIIEKAYPNKPEIHREFREELEQKSVSEPIVHVSEATVKRKVGRQKLKTTTGIEIQIPMDQIRDSKSVEFINLPDGTVSVLIKNVSRAV